MEQWVLMKEVDNIQNLNPMHRILWDTLPETRKEELCLQNKNSKDIGIGFAIGGAIVTGVGLILIIPAALKDFNHITDNPDWVSEQLTGGAIVCAIGTVSLLTGIILATTSNSKIKDMKQKVKNYPLILILHHHVIVFQWCTGFKLHYSTCKIKTHPLINRTSSGTLFPA